MPMIRQASTFGDCVHHRLHASVARNARTASGRPGYISGL
jgi:hypothetical protein